MKLYISISAIIIIFCSAICCGDPDPIFNSTDSIALAKGKLLFGSHCSGCHQFQRDGIGPSLGSITHKVSRDWLERFIRDPQKMIAARDPRADSLHKKFKSVMPSFAIWKKEEINAVIIYLHTQQGAQVKALGTGKGITDPIPDKIPISGHMAEIVTVVQFPVTTKPGQRPFTRITKMEQPPGSGALFVNDLRGKLYKLVNNRPVIYLDLAKQRPQFIDEPGLATGFGSFAFHPDFSDNGFIYTTHTEKPGYAKADFTFEDSLPVEVQWVLSEWKATDPLSDTLIGSSRELLRIDMIAGAHGIQEIAFNASVKKGERDYGLLYIGVGDGASVQLGFPFVAYGKNRIWGSILRIDPQGNNSINKKYGNPPNNPFYHHSEEKSVNEIYAYGFRNPHRMTWTSSGELMVSNVGQNNIESIYAVKPGVNCGWPFREGAFNFNPYGDLNEIFPLDPDDSARHITYPVMQYDHDEGLAVCGGYEYQGKFLFGDIPSGRLFYFNLKDIYRQRPVAVNEWKISIKGKQISLKQLCGNNRVDLHMGRDASGSIYLLTKADGMLYKVKSFK